MTKEQWEYCSNKALELFAFGQVFFQVGGSYPSGGSC